MKEQKASNMNEMMQTIEKQELKIKLIRNLHIEEEERPLQLGPAG